MSSEVKYPLAPETSGDLNTQIEAAIAFAKKTGSEVIELKFNGTSVFVAPGSNIPEVKANWYAIRQDSTYPKTQGGAGEFAIDL